VTAWRRSTDVEDVVWVSELDPDMDFQETARPVLMRGMFGQR
jgi:hypothetical protein